MWSGCKEGEANIGGVAIAVRTELITKGYVSQPTCHNNRLMSVDISENNNAITTFICCYAPTECAPSDTKQKFYEDLNRITRQVPRSNNIIVTGDMNARVGKGEDHWRNIIGSHGFGNRNENGGLLLEYCSQNDLSITNTRFQQRMIHKVTWRHPRSSQWHLLDYIVIRSSRVKDVLRCRSMRGAHCETDHIMVKACIRSTLKQKYNVKKPNKNFNIADLKSENIRKAYQEKLFCNTRDDDSVEDLWIKLKNAYMQAAEQTLSKRKNKQRDWFDKSDEEVSAALQKKQEAHQHFIENENQETRKAYRQARRVCQREIRRIKQKWWEDKTRELQRLRDENDIRGLYQGIKEIIGPTKRSLNLVKSKEGEVLKEKTDQLKRWKEHFYEVLNQENPVETIIPEFDNILGELICDDPPSTIEISRAINALKNHKSAGEDKIVAEMIKVGGDKSIQMLQSLLNKIWREKVVPQDWRDSMVVPIHKKGDKANCSNYRGISLLSVPGKVLSRILYGRLLPMADAYLREGQCGFRRERSTVDMIFSTRQLVEKSLEQNTTLCLAFIDISKAFDSVNRDILFNVLEKMSCPEVILSLLRSLHESTNARVRVDGDFSEPFQVTTGVRQGCVLAPLLFLLYIHCIIFNTMSDADVGVHICHRSDSNLFNKRNLKAKTKVQTSKIQDLMFADDCALTAKNPEDLQNLLNAFVMAAEKFGLKVNIQKTEIMFINCPPHNITIGQEVLKEVESFKYLGSYISNNGSLDKEIENRISAASSAFGRLYYRVWKPHHLSLKTKLSIYETTVLSTLLYSSECWTTLKHHLRKLNGFHIRCLKSILKITWRDYVPNEEVLRKSEMMAIEDIIRQRRLRWAGHLSRMPEDRIAHRIAFAELREGHRGRHKPKQRWTDTLKADLKALHINHNTWRELATDRNTWRTKVKSICTELHQEKIKTAVTLRTEKKRSEENLEWQCPLCSFKRQGVRARQYVLSHISQKHPREPSPETTQDPLTCRICNLKCKSKSGLSCHMRIIHQDRGDTSRRPIKTMNTHDPGLATTSTPQNEPPQSPNMQSQSSQLNLSPPDDRSCPVCRRTCKSRAGLKIHMRNNQQCRQLLERSIIGNDAGS